MLASVVWVFDFINNGLFQFLKKIESNNYQFQFSEQNFSGVKIVIIYQIQFGDFLRMAVKKLKNCLDNPHGFGAISSLLI